MLTINLLHRKLLGSKQEITSVCVIITSQSQNLGPCDVTSGYYVAQQLNSSIAIKRHKKIECNQTKNFFKKAIGQGLHEKGDQVRMKKLMIISLLH